MIIDINRCFSKNEQIMCKQIGDGLCLIDPYRRKLIKLNLTASVIWELLDSSKSVSYIIKVIIDKFEVKENVAKRDTLNLLKELFMREMIY